MFYQYCFIYYETALNSAENLYYFYGKLNITALKLHIA